MKVRYPQLDFSSLRANWAKVPEFAQNFNAFSTVPAHVEPFLVKVMTKVKKALDADQHADLIRDIEIFNKQEIQHCKIHLAFNKKIYELGYEGMADIEKPYQADYDRFLKTKSLRFNLAYCEGFEAVGSSAAQVFFENFKDYLVDADDAAVNMWKWHLAEEFEHRAVAFDAYEALYGNGPFAYLYRVWGFMYAAKHIGDHTNRVVAYLIGKDREGMTPEELKASIKREKEVIKKNEKANKKHLIKVFSPFYNPAKKTVSPGMEEVLASFPDTRQ